MKTRLARTAKDIFKQKPKDWLIYNGTIAFYRATGLWRYPVPTSGDFETMTRRDQIYWLFKAQFPLTRAVKNSGLEAYFEKQSTFRWSLPSGFQPSTELSLSAVGDLMDHPYLPHSGDSLYENSAVADLIFGADVSMANLECVVYPEATASFTLTQTEAPPLYYKLENFNAAKGIKNRQYTFMATANNHSLDCGGEGVASTLRILKKNGIAFNGTNESEKDSQSATILEKNGFKLGMISHTFGLNAKKPPKDKPWIANRTHLNGAVSEINFSQIEKQIQFCRENKVDAIIAQLHWGLEHEFYPRPEQLEVAHHLAEMGFDAIIGHHPHVIQPMEHYRTKRDPDRVVPIYYSLGNLMTPFSLPVFRSSAVARIQLSKGITKDGSPRTYVKHADMKKVFQEIDEKLRLVINDETSERKHS